MAIHNETTIFPSPAIPVYQSRCVKLVFLHYKRKVSVWKFPLKKITLFDVNIDTLWKLPLNEVGRERKSPGEYDPKVKNKSRHQAQSHPCNINHNRQAMLSGLTRVFHECTFKPFSLL